MSFLARIFGGRNEREDYRPLYEAIVNGGRDTGWYLEGEVPDTVTGRFDMIAAVFTLTLLRLEEEEARARSASVLLAELFIEDMEGSIRQLGIGDVVVGKHVSKLMGAVGGRLGAFRTEIEAGGDFSAPVARNIFHDAPPSRDAVDYVASRLRSFWEQLRTVPVESLLSGSLPRP